MEQNVMVQSVNYGIMQMVPHQVCAAPILQHAHSPAPFPPFKFRDFVVY